MQVGKASMLVSAPGLVHLYTAHGVYMQTATTLKVRNERVPSTHGTHTRRPLHAVAWRPLVALWPAGRMG